MPSLREIPASARAIVGASRREITPPVGIYSRMWGAAKHDKFEGTHEPTVATVLVIRGHDGGKPLVLVNVDLCVVKGQRELRMFRDAVMAESGADDAGVMIACTHTHGVGFFSLDRAHLPGGDMIAPYFEKVREAIRDATREAMLAVKPATFTWATGRCSLASNRDLPDPAPGQSRYICGYNPAEPADDTLLVGRITRDDDNTPLATIVNYACHPTTLAWDNRKSSPDFVGSMRRLVESLTCDAPCLFLQGASGELSPRYQYVGDPDIPEQHGRQLGYAVMSTLTSMLPPGQCLAYQGVMESGAPLAVWKPQPFDVPTDIASRRHDVALPMKPWPTAEQLQREVDACTDRTMQERIRRKLHLVRDLNATGSTAQPVWIWRIGSAILVGQPNETYSDFQIELRKRFPHHAMVVMNVTNGSIGYISPDHKYDLDIYQVWQTPFDRGSMPVLVGACAKQIAALM